MAPLTAEPLPSPGIADPQNVSGATSTSTSTSTSTQPQQPHPTCEALYHNVTSISAGAWKTAHHTKYTLARLEAITAFTRLSQERTFCSLGHDWLRKRNASMEPELSAHESALISYQRVMHYSDLEMGKITDAFAMKVDELLITIARRTIAAEQYRADSKHDTASDLDLQSFELETATLFRTAEGDALRAETSCLVEFFSEKNQQLHPRNSVHEIADVLKRLSLESRRFLRKACTAIFGGLVLIVPTLIMMLHPGLLTALMTMSLSILAVGILLSAVMREAEPKDVFGHAAAYAAVLVVFVGTSGSSGGSGGSTTSSSGGDGPNVGESLSNGAIAGIVVGSMAGLLVLMLLVWSVWADVAGPGSGIPYPIPGVKLPKAEEDGSLALSRRHKPSELELLFEEMGDLVNSLSLTVPDEVQRSHRQERDFAAEAASHC